MALSRLPLGYCTNVHPGLPVAEVEEGLDRYTLPVKERFGKPLAAGLWLAKPVIGELLAAPDATRRFADGLARRGLTCHTLNAFPFGDFHDARVKEKVYLPDWSDPLRLEYTLNCRVRTLAEFLPEEIEGSISTLPLGFKELPRPADFHEAAMSQLIACARELGRLREKTNRIVRLAIEPEPLCLLETTDEAIAFFDQLRDAASAGGALDVVQNHLGLCYDVCHQAVEFEDVAASVAALDRANIRINKVHISCALELGDPASNAEGREALRRYVEPRYLHQTIARSRDGRVARWLDLNDELLDRPNADFAGAPAWRVHFHVPVDAERMGPLATTRDDLRKALSAVAKLDYAPHLEVETYTWEVLPGAAPADRVEGLARELIATDRLLSSEP